MNIAIILSGGQGTRLGSSIPKQYIEVDGKMIIEYSFSTIIESTKIDAVIIVCTPEWEEELKKITNSDKPVIFARPGDTRQLSIFNGLMIANQIFKDKIDIVVIHDAARPLLQTQLLEESIIACEDGFEGSMPVLPIKDTVYLSDDSVRISNLLDRSKLFAGQAPEAFVYDKYLKAHLTISDRELRSINGSTELAFKSGMNIKLIKGDTRNFKITNIEDLELFKSICYESKRAVGNK